MFAEETGYSSCCTVCGMELGCEAIIREVDSETEYLCCRKCANVFGSFLLGKSLKA